MTPSFYYEIIDTSKLAYIINNIQYFKPFLRASCFNDPKYCVITTLKNILNACDKKGRLKVTYHQKNNKGRCMADLSLSYQSMIREVRHTLAQDIYVDVDAVNAHPTALLYLANKQNKKCEFLKYYINNREECLKPFETREQGKKVYLALTNGGEYDYNNLKENQKSAHLKGYANEMKELHELFSELYPDEFKAYAKQKKIKKNFKAGFMNTLLCDLENKILDVMIDFFNPTPSNQIVKCFDGVMLLNNKEYDIKGCEKRINEVFKNINMKLSIKPFNEGLILPEIIPKYIYNESYMFDGIIQPSKKQLYLFNMLLNEIEINKDNVHKIIISSKNWAKCEKVLNIITNVLDKNNIHIDIRKIWNYINNPNIKPLSIAYLLMLHNESTLKKKLKKKDFQYFKMSSHIDQLEGIENIKNIEIKKINQQYVTNKNGTPNLSDFDMKTLKNKIIMIKSHTGSGKTELMKYLADKLQTHTFISLATRIILAEYHSDILKTHFYLDKTIKLNNPNVWQRIGNISGMSCVIDSLIHIKINPNNKYVLFLDETSSLLDYIINKDNLKKKRRDIFNILRYLLINCDYCFCLDADINTHTINFINNILGFYKSDIEINKKYILSDSDKQDDDNFDYDEDDCYNLGLPKSYIKNTPVHKNIVLYNNIYKVNRCDINDYSSLSSIMRALIDDIKSDKTLFICSDKNECFYNDIFMKIITFIEMEIKLKDVKTANDKRILKDIKNNKFSFYSADVGNKDDFKYSKKLQQKVVFVSPVITTGVDLNYKAHVYGFYFGTHLTASTVVQQLGRIRQPISINTYFALSTYNYKYDSFEELEEDFTQSREELRKIIDFTRTDRTFDDIEAQFKTYSDFINEKLKALRFHTLDILHNKGDNIVYKNDEIDDFLKDIKIDKKERKLDEETLKKRFEYICNPNLLKNLNSEDINILTDICEDEKMFNSHISLRKILLDSEQDLMMQINATDDIESHNITARTTKIILLKELMNKIGIDNIENVNYYDDFKNIFKSKLTYSIKKTYFEAFRLSKHEYKNKLSKLEAYELILTMINNLAPSFVSSKRIKIKGTDYRIKVLDYEKANEQIQRFNRKVANIYI